MGAPPPTRAADRALARPRRRPLAALAALAALLAVAATASYDLGTPDPRPADAPVGEFSAGRAYQNVRALATRPHPAGSPANEQVRAHVEGVLRDPTCSGHGSSPAPPPGSSPDSAPASNPAG
ncbi:hypothetical protein ACFY2R_14140 [Micromonospora olivasterospora]|uniref:Uncharacterized protein n=1 Tax=Micromonospora olivasterospora TaxID=1880 RepID=A0A562I737_MICOL|nr:hypothetical protein [Micromonospora olivasterospora]TWH66722.1 hypothetical protein JD77_01680 [Micromonospora olivasterospora]